MANPTVPSDQSGRKRDIDGKMVVKAQEANVADIAQTVNTGLVRVVIHNAA